MELRQNRTISIDILKLFCAFLVVCIHQPFPGEVGRYVMAFARIAVPVFFMITGYFYSDVVKRGSEKKQIQKILKLIIAANVLYCIQCVVDAIVQGDRSSFQNRFTSEKLIEFVCFNQSPVGRHLWYLGAIFYVLVVIWIADRLKIRKWLYLLTPILTLVELLLGKYSLLFFDTEFSRLFSRNFLFVGIPFFCIGCLIRRGMGRRIKLTTLRLWVIVFSVLSLLEYYITVKIEMGENGDQFLSTKFLAVAVFLCALKSNPHHFKGAAVLGRKYATWLYILHPLLRDIFRAVTRRLEIYETYAYVAPVAIFITVLAILVAGDWLLARIKSYAAHFKNRKCAQ